MIADSLKERILKIKLVIMDIDGVLTDGRIILGNYGDELKFFDVQDGLGMVLLRRAGLKTVIITSKKSRINMKRAREVNISKIYQKVSNKLKAYEKVSKKFKLSAEQTCFVGDDLLDIPVMKRIGFAVAVQNAVLEVKEIAHYVTEQRGGRGAVREVADMILKCQDKWRQATESYFK